MATASSCESVCYSSYLVQKFGMSALAVEKMGEEHRTEVGVSPLYIPAQPETFHLLKFVFHISPFLATWRFI